MRFKDSLFTIINSEAKVKLARFLLKHDAVMSEREIASIIGISHMSVNRFLQEFAEMNFVQYSSVGKAHVWTVNKKSYVYQNLARVFKNIEDVPAPLTELKGLILKRCPKAIIERVVLFGSVAKQHEQFNSDIDLFILVKKEQDKDKLEKDIEKLSLECLERFGNCLSPYILSKAELQQRKNLKVIEGIGQGIQIFPNGKDAAS